MCPILPLRFSVRFSEVAGAVCAIDRIQVLANRVRRAGSNLDGGDGTGITPEFKTCEVPCWVYSAECLECLLVPETGCEIAFQELHSDLVASENADFPKDEYPNLYQSQEWKDAIYACIPEVFPAVVTPEVGEAVDFKYVGNEFMKPCIEPYLMPWFEAFTVPADQKEKFFTGTGMRLPSCF